MSADLEKLDCADHACVFKHNGPGGMRTNGGSCRCQPRKIKAYYEKLLEQVHSERLAASFPDHKVFIEAAFNTTFVDPFQFVDWAYRWLRSQVKPAPRPERLSDEELNKLAKDCAECAPFFGNTNVAKYVGYKEGYRACEKRYRGDE